MYKIGFYVPDTHVELVKQAMFAAGAGRIGKYDSCCWQTPGQGQFRALDGSQPFVGQQGVVERVPELRVEMVCEGSVLKPTIVALRATHPYEELAFDVVKLESVD